MSVQFSREKNSNDDDNITYVKPTPSLAMADFYKIILPLFCKLFLNYFSDFANRYSTDAITYFSSVNDRKIICKLRKPDLYFRNIAPFLSHQVKIKRISPSQPRV